MAEPVDYYGYRPLVTPARPIALVGPRAVRADRVARVVSILTGLPLFLLDRAVEHRFGKDLRRVILEDGDAARRTAEAALLARPLRQPTAHVLALSEVTLLDEALRGMIRASSTVVYVQPDERDPELDALLSLIADLTVEHGGRAEQRVAQEVVERLGLDVELP
jgi:hypothetical protein